VVDLLLIVATTYELLAMELFELCDSVFVDGVDEDFEALLLEDLEEW
jgi:hypothetical protein